MSPCLASGELERMEVGDGEVEEEEGKREKSSSENEEQATARIGRRSLKRYVNCRFLNVLSMSFYLHTQDPHDHTDCVLQVPQPQGLLQTRGAVAAVLEGVCTCMPECQSLLLILF